MYLLPITRLTALSCLFLLLQTPAIICSDPAPAEPDPQEAEVRWALISLMPEMYHGLGDTAIMVRQTLSNFMLSIGAAFEQLWEKIKHIRANQEAPAINPSQSAQNQDQDEQKHEHEQMHDMRHEPDFNPNLAPDLANLHQHIAELHAYSTEAYDKLHEHLDSDTAKISYILKNYSTSALIADAAFGATGASILYFIYRYELPKSLTRPHTRFITGLELPIITALVSLVKPMGVFAIAGLIFWRTKQHFQFPLLEKHKKEIEKFHLALNEHEQKTHQTLERHFESYTHALKVIEEEFKRDLTHEREKNKTLVTTCTQHVEKQAAIIAHDQQEQAAELKQRLLTVTKEFEKHLDAVQQSVGEVREISHFSKEQLALAMPQIKDSVDLVGKLARNSEQQLAFIRQQAQTRTRQQPSIPAAGPHIKPKPGLLSCMQATPD